MVNDEEMFASFTGAAPNWCMPLSRRERRGRRRAAKHYLAKGVTGPEGHALSVPPDVEGEAANRAIGRSRSGGCAAPHRSHLLIQAHEAIRRARASGERATASL